MQDARISSVRDLIRALGGTQRVAEWAHVTPPAVSQWIAASQIPDGWHLRILAEARRRGLTVDTVAVFGVALPDAGIQSPASAASGS